MILGYNTLGLGYYKSRPIRLLLIIMREACMYRQMGLWTGMEITGIASQFAMQSRPICDASSHIRRNNCDTLLVQYFSRFHCSDFPG